MLKQTFKMLNRKSFALSVTIALLIGFKFSTIYVPEGFESPIKYKSMAILLGIGQFVVNSIKIIL